MCWQEIANNLFTGIVFMATSGQATYQAFFFKHFWHLTLACIMIKFCLHARHPRVHLSSASAFSGTPCTVWFPQTAAEITQVPCGLYVVNFPLTSKTNICCGFLTVATSMWTVAKGGKRYGSIVIFFFFLQLLFLAEYHWNLKQSKYL